jgi:cytochrome P450
MPFTNAVLQESFRVSSLAYSGVPRSAQADIQVGSYTIPKGATVTAFLYHVHHDPKYYKDPKTFNPSRFIDASGNFINDERVIPFGIGKRFCLGQSLAQKEFFIFFTGLVQQFEFKQAPGTVLASYSDIYPPGFLRNVPPYEVVLKKRLL